LISSLVERHNASIHTNRERCAKYQVSDTKAQTFFACSDNFQQKQLLPGLGGISVMKELYAHSANSQDKRHRFVDNLRGVAGHYGVVADQGIVGGTSAQ